jgi:hypothetical protein
VEARSLLAGYDEEFAAVVADVLRAGIATAEFRPTIDVVRDARLMVHMLDATAELAAADRERLHDTVAAATRTVLAAVAAST